MRTLRITMFTFKQFDGMREHTFSFEDLLTIARLANGVATGNMSRDELEGLVARWWPVAEDMQWIWPRITTMINTIASAHRPSKDGIFISLGEYEALKQDRRTLEGASESLNAVESALTALGHGGPGNLAERIMTLKTARLPGLLPMSGTVTLVKIEEK